MAAAQLVALGLPGLRYLDTTDTEQRLMLRAIALKTDEYVDGLQRRLAIHVANAIAKAFPKGLA